MTGHYEDRDFRDCYPPERERLGGRSAMIIVFGLFAFCGALVGFVVGKLF